MALIVFALAMNSSKALRGENCRGKITAERQNLLGKNFQLN